MNDYELSRILIRHLDLPPVYDPAKTSAQAPGGMFLLSRRFPASVPQAAAGGGKWTMSSGMSSFVFWEQLESCAKKMSFNRRGTIFAPAGIETIGGKC